jgi:hypothetical protein
VQPGDFTTLKFKKVTVYYREKPLNAYTVIRAQIPDSDWTDGQEVSYYSTLSIMMLILFS